MANGNNPQKGGKKQEWLSGGGVYLSNLQKAIKGAETDRWVATGVTVSFRGIGDVLVVMRRRNLKTGMDEVHFESVYTFDGLLEALNNGWDKTNWKVDQFSKHNKAED